MTELSEDICSSLLCLGPLILLFPKPSFLLLSIKSILDFLGGRVHRSNGDIAVHVQCSVNCVNKTSKSID